MPTNHPEFRYRNLSSSREGRFHKRQKQSSAVQLVLLGLVLLAGAWLVLSILRIQTVKAYKIIDSTESANSSFVVIDRPIIDKQKLGSQIGAILKKYSNYDISVVFRDKRTGKAFEWGENKPMVAASITKLLTASYYLHEVDNGKRKLSDSVSGGEARRLIKDMIEVSDNNAWVVLDRALGGSNLESYAKEIGLTSYKKSPNVISAEDTAKLLLMLEKGKLLSPDSTKLLKNHLKNANYRQYIVSAVGDGVSVYHKVGYLEDRIHDSAIVDNGKYPYILVIFSESDNYNLSTGATFIREITNVVNAPYEKD